MCNDKIGDCRLVTYKEIGKILNCFSIDNLNKYEAQLVLFLINGLRFKNL